MSFTRPQTVTKTEAAFLALREAIEDGALEPGAPLRLKGLIEQLGMSPTPIREALRLLQAEGLVTHEPHRGMTVAEYSPESAEEVYRLRAELEPLATELAGARATPEQLAGMRALHDELSRAVERGDRRTDLAQLNAAWHRAVYQASGSRLLQEFIARLWTAVPVQAVWLTRRGPRSVAQHGEIMDALERGDAAGARELMRAHVEYGAVSTGEHLRRRSRRRQPGADPRA